MRYDSLRKGSHSVFLLHGHVVLVTKYRKAIFKEEHLNYLKVILTRVCRKFETRLVEFNGETNHVHLLVNYPPKIRLSEFIPHLKGVSSRLLRKRYRILRKSYYRSVLWSPSYFVGSVDGAPLSILRDYISAQQTPTSST